jgi:hypothetical protein
MALRSTNNYEAAANLLTIPLYAYNPALGLGASAVIGYAFHGMYDLDSAYNNGSLQSKPAIKSVLEDILIDTSLQYPPTVGNVFVTPSGNKIITAQTTDQTITTSNFNAYVSNGTMVNIGNNFYISSAYLYYRFSSDASYTYFHRWIYQSTTQSPTNEPPSSIPTDKKTAVNNRLVQESSSNETIRNQLEETVKENPNLVPAPAQISQTDIQNFITNNNLEINNNYINTLNALIEQYPNDVNLKAELARAQAESQKEEENPKETFSPIAENGFAEPYIPGEYDIPERFSSFLDNVKSSSLFSFSSSGSPIYQINGGQTFGSHTIDLSETLSTGLAVLKTILLACFGFLSIRAVIMKR